SMELNPAAYAQSAPAIENPLKYYLENKSKQSDYGYGDDILIEGDSHYWQMLTEEEKSVYNYLLAKKGDKAADEYLSDIQEELNRRYGEAVAENLKDRPILKGAYSVGAGAIGALSNTIQGLGAMSGSEEVLPSSAWEYAHAKNVENSSGTGKFVYNLGYNLGNMAPQLAAGYMTGGLFGPGVASTASGAAMAVPTFGDAYADALQGGYTKTQAVTYAGLSAAKEVGLSYLLGGFDKAGKVSLGKLGEKALPKIEQAIARVAKKPTLNALLKTASAVVADAGGEFTEEYLQELITPVLRNVIFGEKNSVNMFTPEALEAGIMGSALSLLVNVFGMNIKNDYAAKKLQSNLVAAYLDSGESHAVATKKADSQIARIFNGSLMLELEEEQFAATKAGRSEGNIVGMSTVLMRDDGQDEMTIRNVNKLAVFPATDFDYELPPPQLDELKKQIEGAYAKGEKLTLFKGKNGNVQMFFTDKSGKTSHNLAVTPNGKTEKIYGVKSGDLRLKPEVFVPYADSDVTPGAVAGQEAAQMEKQTTNTYEVKTPSRGDIALQEQGNMSDDLKSQSAGHDIDGSVIQEVVNAENEMVDSTLSKEKRAQKISSIAGSILHNTRSKFNKDALVEQLDEIFNSLRTLNNNGMAYTREDVAAAVTPIARAVLEKVGTDGEASQAEQQSLATVDEKIRSLTDSILDKYILTKRNSLTENSKILTPPKMVDIKAEDPLSLENIKAMIGEVD
ncbi:MAG: hypothetical protein RSD39_05415, partial [Oscillospiraceae bacterium]